MQDFFSFVIRVLFALYRQTGILNLNNNDTAESIGQVSVMYRSSVGQVSVKYRSSIGQVSVMYQSCIGRVSMD